MKLRITFIIILLCIGFSYAQNHNLNYGLSIGATHYGTERLDGNGFNGRGTKHIAKFAGVFVEYPYDESLAFKATLGYGEAVERLNFTYPGTSEIKTLQCFISAQYDVNGNYGRGLFLVGGPRVSYVLGARDENTGDSTKIAYTNLRLGIQIGFGFAFLKHFELVFIGDYGFTNIVTLEDINSTTLAAFGLLTIDLSSIFGK